MAGFLGMVLGAGLGYEKDRIQRERQNNDKAIDMISNAMISDPALAQNKELMDFVTKHTSKDFGSIIGHIGQARLQHDQQFQQAIMGGGTPQQGGASPMMPAPQGGGMVQPAMATQQAQAQPQQQGGWPSDMQGLQNQLENLYRAQSSGAFPDPRHQQLLTNYIKQTETRIQQLQHHEDFQQNQQRLNQAHQDSEFDREQSRNLQNQLHQDTLGLMASNENFMHLMAKEHEDDARVGHFNSATQNLQSQTQKIAAMLSSANPADRATVKALLQQRNAQAKMLQGQADKYGMDYDAEQFKPLTVNDVPGWLAQHTGGMMGGSNPVLGEASPTAPAAKGAGGLDAARKNLGL